MEMKELIEFVKTVGFPAVVALFLMVKDWAHSRWQLRALVRIGEILEIDRGAGAEGRHHADGAEKGDR